MRSLSSLCIGMRTRRYVARQNSSSIRLNAGALPNKGVIVVLMGVELLSK